MCRVTHGKPCVNMHANACRTHGKPCFNMHANACRTHGLHVRHMASHVSDTWHVMCQNACINGDVRRRRGEQERKREREERREKERRKEKEKRNKRKEKENKERKRKEVRGFFLSSLAFRRSKLVGLRSKVWRFDEGLRFKR